MIDTKFFRTGEVDMTTQTITAIEYTNTIGLFEVVDKLVIIPVKRVFIVRKITQTINGGDFETRYTDLYRGNDRSAAKDAYEAATFQDAGFGEF